MNLVIAEDDLDFLIFLLWLSELWEVRDAPPVPRVLVAVTTP